MNSQVFALTKKVKKKSSLIEDYIESTMTCYLLFFLSEVMALVYFYCHSFHGGSIQGDIVQIDTEATLRHRDPSKGLRRFSFNYFRYVCQVNQEKVVVEKLRRDYDLLYFVDSYQLWMAVFVKYYEDSGYLLMTSPYSSVRWKKQLNEVYYSYSLSGKDANDKSPFFRQLTETKRN